MLRMRVQEIVGSRRCLLWHHNLNARQVDFSNMTQVERFWDEAYAGFDAAKPVTGNLFIPADGVELRGKRCLILACGTGEHVVRACRQGAEVTALDISRQAVENAKAMVGYNGLTANFVVADAAALQIARPDRST